MRRLRTTSTQRLLTIVAAVVALALTGAFAQAAISGSDPEPEPKALDRAVHDAVTAPPVEGVSARITFTNGLLPSGSLPNGGGSPLAAGAEGRLWLASGGRARLELQSEAGDAQIVADGERLTVYDSSTETAYTMAVPAGKEEPEHEEPSLEDVQRGLDRLATAWTLSGAQPTSTGGRPTYTVRIAPKDDGGLLGAAELAWDALNGVPLRAAVYAQGQDAPVLELEADDVSYPAENTQRGLTRTGTLRRRGQPPIRFADRHSHLFASLTDVASTRSVEAPPVLVVADDEVGGPKARQDVEPRRRAGSDVSGTGPETLKA